MNLVTYLVSGILIVVGAYYVFRMAVRRDFASKGQTTVISAFLQLFICVAYMAFPYTYLPSDWYLLPTLGIPPVRRITALTLIMLGLVLTLFSMLFVLGIKRSFGWEVDNLITSGPYKFSRNPQLVTFALVIIGVIVYWPSLYHLGWLALYGIVFHMMVITEEEHLTNIYHEKISSLLQSSPPLYWTPKHTRYTTQIIRS